MRLFFQKLRIFFLKLILFLLAISLVSVIIFRWVPVPVTSLMIIRCIEQQANGKPVMLRKVWVPLGKISNNLQLAVVCSEDQNFLQHHGFDFEAIGKAFDHNKNSKHKRGASTISQQTAKNVFLWPYRSWIRKIFEVYFTFLIELCWNKERIMEVYLNVIEMGDGVYGAEAASRYYFHKSSKDLMNSEASFLAAILPNPIQFSAVRSNTYIQLRQQWILQQMGLWGGVLKY
jgi:monofunctional biosynthetic peptidoglycan transglycosylase